MKGQRRYREKYNKQMHDRTMEILTNGESEAVVENNWTVYKQLPVLVSKNESPLRECQSRHIVLPDTTHYGTRGKKGRKLPADVRLWFFSVGYTRTPVAPVLPQSAVANRAAFPSYTKRSLAPYVGRYLCVVHCELSLFETVRIHSYDTQKEAHDEASMWYWILENAYQRKEVLACARDFKRES